MGANIASEVADEKFCETTIGESPVITYIHSTACYVPSLYSPHPHVAIFSPLIRQRKETQASEMREDWDIPRERVTGSAEGRYGKSQESPFKALPPSRFRLQGPDPRGASEKADADTQFPHHSGARGGHSRDLWGLKGERVQRQLWGGKSLKEGLA